MSYINRDKPEIGFLYKLAEQVRALEFELSIKDLHSKNKSEKIDQYERITGINSSKLPKYGSSLEKYSKEGLQADLDELVNQIRNASDLNKLKELTDLNYPNPDKP